MGTPAETMIFAIRPEVQDDASAIRRVHERAFARKEEADLVEALRHDGSVVISLVAEEGRNIIGHALLTKMEAPFRALGLAPVAVLPDYQGKGVGGALIAEGLRQARLRGWEGVFVVGEPRYYARFGFDAIRAAGFTSPYAGPYFMAMALQGAELPLKTGRVDYAPPFAAFS
jgi:putative acetyltransferase